MNFLHIIASVNPKGGGPIEGLKQRGLHLAKLGHAMQVVSVDDPAASYVKTFPLPVVALGPSYSNYRFSPRLGAWLSQHAREYDHVVIHGIWQFHAFEAARVLRRLGIPYHVFTHGMLDPWFKEHYPFKHFKKWIYWTLAEHATLKGARRVLFTSEEERLRARQSFRAYDVHEAVVPYGAAQPDQDPEAVRAVFFAQFPELQGKRLLLYLSRLHEKKGCDLLIQAWGRVAQQHAGVHLVMAGPGTLEYVQHLRQLATGAGVAERMTWPGMLQGDLKWGAFHAAEAFVLPSHQENFGIAVAEALGCGLPVLISDKVNVWREVQGDGAGLIAPDTLEGTVSSLDRWLALTETERVRMSVAALDCHRHRFTVAAMTEGLIEILQ